MSRATLPVLLILLLAGQTRGEIWCPSADGQVVDRAEVIAVARVKPGTIEYVPHTAKNPGHGRSWEHHVTIVVSRTVKGKLAAGEHRVLLQYGLTPCVGGKWNQDGGMISLPDRSEDVIEIVDDHWLLDVALQEPPDDLRENHVWLLRRARAGGSGADGKEMLGIEDGQDLQPLDRLDYLRLYLLDDPEPALRRHIQQHPEDGSHVLPYLHHKAVQRVIADPDPARRVQRLLPYFCSYVLYGWGDEAGEAIEAAGEVAVPYLIALLSDSDLYENRRTQVIAKLGRIGSKRAVPALIALVEENASMLAGVAKAGRDAEGQLSRPGVRRRLYDMSSTIYSLGLIGDTSAASLVRRVHETWKGVLPEDHALIDNARITLERLAGDKDR